MFKLTEQSEIDFRFWLYSNKGIRKHIFDDWKPEKQLGYYIEFFKGTDFVKGLWNGLQINNKKNQILEFNKNPF